MVVSSSGNIISSSICIGIVGSSVSKNSFVLGFEKKVHQRKRNGRGQEGLVSERDGDGEKQGETKRERGQRMIGGP